MATTTTKIRYRIEYAAVKAVIFFINIIPYRLALRIGDFIAFLGYHVFRVRRDVTLSNLRNSFKDRYTSKEYDEIGYRAYRNFAYSMIEFGMFPSLRKKPGWRSCSTR